MKKQKGFTLIQVAGSLVAVFILVIAVSWIVNAVKLTSCDFKSDYKCEVAHSIGLFIPPTSVVTVWFGTDE